MLAFSSKSPISYGPLGLVLVMVLTACSKSEMHGGDVSDGSDAPQNLDWQNVATTATGDSIDRGRSLFQMCTSCHGIDEGELSPAGPSLYRVAGRKVGSLDGYPYTSSLGSGTSYWTVEHFDAFLANPQEIYPNNGMAYAGLKKPDDRQDLIAYVATKSLALE